MMDQCVMEDRRKRKQCQGIYLYTVEKSGTGEEQTDMGEVLPRLPSMVISRSIILLQLGSVPMSVA